MPEITYQSVTDYIAKNQAGSFDPVVLIHGEPFLYERITHELVNALIPDIARQKHGYEAINHREDGRLADVIERMNTYSFFSGTKVVELREATVFIAGHNHGNILSKIKQLQENKDYEKAADRFLTLLSRLQADLSDFPEDISDEKIAEKLQLSEENIADIEWIKKICGFCRERNLPVPASGDDADILKNAIERGFPKNHFLIITTDTVDKRKALYKTIKKYGTIIDCAIPKGNRKADLDAQRAFLREHVREMLQRHHKQIDGAAFEQIFSMTGFDVRAFMASVEKLVDYARDRDRISIQDVQAVLVRTKIDPVYELTGALAAKDAVLTLQYISSLLDSGFHYLQILAAMINQVRKLLVIKDFQESPQGRTWQPTISYDRFRQTIIPLIVAYDDTVLEKVRLHQSAIRGEEVAGADETKKKPSSDLVIAKNPNNPYPVFLQFQHAGKFSRKSLLAAVMVLSRADVQLKTTGRNPLTVLEQAVWDICGPGSPP